MQKCIYRIHAHTGQPQPQPQSFQYTTIQNVLPPQARKDMAETITHLHAQDGAEEAMRIELVPRPLIT